MKKTRFDSVFEANRRIYTENLVPGTQVYGERIWREGGKEYREWDCFKSKLGAAMMLGIRETGIMRGAKVLYLGASTGTTISHVSDIVKDGVAFGVEFAPRMMRDLVFLCQERKNIIPIMADAFHPERYLHLVPQTDAVFQDIAQKNQEEIFRKNCQLYLKNGGRGILALKARSVDVTKKPRDIFQETEKKLREWARIIDIRDIGDYEKDHCVFVIEIR
ncbi:fibrillarin-like rRNA/tRNA 2'-O-methyltransferase [Candidatus Woesearchaeota archaeon]|nr:fibrillarin-like rRNA/tRNA 2'-O-methyltransferase [Candidatus Woesearchaeota archaeon]